MSAEVEAGFPEHLFEPGASHVGQSILSITEAPQLLPRGPLQTPQDAAGGMICFSTTLLKSLEGAPSCCIEEITFASPGRSFHPCHADDWW